MFTSSWNPTWEERARAHAMFCRALAKATPEGSLRRSILRTAEICEEYAHVRPSQRDYDPLW